MIICKNNKGKKKGNKCRVIINKTERMGGRGEGGGGGGGREGGGREGGEGGRQKLSKKVFLQLI